MASVLVVFASRYGQTSKIAAHIADLTRAAGHAARVVHIEDASDLDMHAYAGVIVAAPVFFARHPRSIQAFLHRHARALKARVTAFVSVSNSAESGNAAARVHAAAIAAAPFRPLSWRPDVVVTAGGAIAYPRYGFFVRRAMLLLARRSGAPTDTRRIHETTDWTRLERDLTPFFAALERTVREGAIASSERTNVERLHSVST